MQMSEQNLAIFLFCEGRAAGEIVLQGITIPDVGVTFRI